MSSNTRRALEAGKTLLIILLTLSAFFLATRAFWAGGTGSGGLFNHLFSAGTAPAPTGGTEQADTGGVARPVRMAVVNSDGRYGIQYHDTAVDELFDALGGLLGEALVTAQNPIKTTRQVWEDALVQQGVYFEFLGSVPLSLLSSWLGEGETAAHSSGDAARILLTQSGEEETLHLLYLDAEDGSYYTCKTSAAFRERLNGYIPNGAAFAFEEPDRYPNLAPDTLILPEPPYPPVYLTAEAADFADGAVRNTLLSILAFSPQAGAMYPVADGWSIRDGSDNLRFEGAGTITYHAGEGDARYPVSGTATRAELVELTGGLISQALLPRCGAAQVYLSEFTQTDGVATLTYSYSLSGADVRLGREGWCAQFIVSNGQITDYILHLRSYEATADTATLLPEFQAMAAMEALDASGRDLLLCYYDGGGSTVSPVWIAR